MGNKGGVGIRLRLRSSSLCFVCSHLAAHRDNVRARNENYVKVKGIFGACGPQTVQLLDSQIVGCSRF